MIQPSKPDNEAQRLLALQRHQILDTPRERSFDDLGMIATALCGTPAQSAMLRASDVAISSGCCTFRRRLSSGCRNTAPTMIATPA